MESVLKGLEFLMEQEDKSSLVAIHDAARPCLIKEDLQKLMDFASEEMKDEGQGVLLAHQPPESVSLGNKNKITKTLDRSKVWLSATPQVFFLEDILRAIDNANEEKKVLLEMLANPGTTYSRDEIGKISGISQERSIDVMITRLRQKLEINPKNPKYLQTIRGAGYVLWIE